MSTPAIFRERMLGVARANRETPYRTQFDMGLYMHGCGTPGCAIGNWVVRGDIQDVIRPVKPRNTFFEVRRDMYDGLYMLPPHGEWILASTPTELRGRYFGISADEWTELFGSQGCGDAKTPDQAADYIEAFVERKWPAPAPPDWNALAEAPWDATDITAGDIEHAPAPTLIDEGQHGKS